MSQQVTQSLQQQTVWKLSSSCVQADCPSTPSSSSQQHQSTDEK